MAAVTRTGSRSPRSTQVRPARSARCSASAAARSAGARRTLRLDSASPSGSRTVGQPTTSTGIDRSATMRRTTANCWKSFSPK